VLLGLLLQAPLLLSPGPAPAPADPAWTTALRRLAATPAWTLSELPPGPEGPARSATLTALLERGSPREVRLAALLAAGAPAASPETRACLRAALALHDEATVLACLLAPAATPAEAAPALAWLAADGVRPLSVRAAATGRLLETGWHGAWPLARSILRAGTPVAEAAPWADWQRSGRYELPKRLLLGSLRLWWRAQGLPAPDYEPNAAWSAQVPALARLEETARRARAVSSPPPEAGAACPGARLLLERAAGGDAVARRALILLAGSAPDLLEGAAGSTGALQAEARPARTPAAALP